MNCPGLRQVVTHLEAMHRDPTPEQRLSDAATIRVTVLSLRGHGWVLPRYLSFDALTDVVRAADRFHESVTG